ncbi:MAG: hypothetical protein ACTSXG_00665 [Alphaproteobacteria bacterium]
MKILNKIICGTLLVIGSVCTMEELQQKPDIKDVLQYAMTAVTQGGKLTVLNMGIPDCAGFTTEEKLPHNVYLRFWEELKPAYENIANFWKEAAVQRFPYGIKTIPKKYFPDDYIVLTANAVSEKIAGGYSDDPNQHLRNIAAHVEELGFNSENDFVNVIEVLGYGKIIKCTGKLYFEGDQPSEGSQTVQNIKQGANNAAQKVEQNIKKFFKRF